MPEPKALDNLNPSDQDAPGSTPMLDSSDASGTVPLPLVLLVVSSGAVELGGRYLHASNLIGPIVGELMGVLGFTILLASAVFVFTRIDSSKPVRIFMLLGLACLLTFQISDLIDEFEWAQAYPLLAKTSVEHRLFENTLLVIGLLLLLAAFFKALLRSDWLVRRYALEKERLKNEVLFREQVEAELLQARESLEAQVSLRTQELAESNRQLREELLERRRFEEHLAMRLRYEEGLANCSHILLADSDPPEALKRALHQLLVAADSSRVYFFENYADTERGVCCRLTHEAWDPVQNPDCKPGIEIDLVYNEGLTDWRRAFEAGDVVLADQKTADPGIAAVLSRFDAKSLLLLPVGWEGRWRGFLGFDETIAERTWTEEEIRMLRTAAEMFGACKDRQSAENALRKAHIELEQRVTDRTSDLSRANDQLSKEMSERRRTEREKISLESQLRQAQKMQAIGTLAGGIAHDFNNILASILGYSELALRRIESDNPFAKYFEEVLRSGNRAKELVRQILLFSRQAEQERAPVHLHLIAQEVSSLMQASCPANIQIEKYLETDAGAVLGDAVQMHQVLLHLCSNAQHAMKRNGGLLEMRVESQEVSSQLLTPYGAVQPGDYVVVTVGDTGHGIAHGTLERIFEPFFTTKTVAEGTGMGLAIAHGIITGMGGVITVESTVGNGSRFILYLPKLAEESVVPPPVSDSLSGSEHIMVIDDESQLVMLWTELLGQYGYEVTGFSNSLEALEVFRQTPETFDLVLLDQTMPGMNGAEVAKAMLNTRGDLPMIMATGFSETIDKAEAARIGIRELVYKPILGHELAAAIRRALGNKVLSRDSVLG